MSVLRKLIEGNPVHKRWVKGTPLDAPARAIVRFVRRIWPNQFISDWGVRNRRDARHIQRILAENLDPDSNCIDIGAHKGVFLQLFVENSPKGRHIAIEPIPELAAALEQSFSMVRVVNCALSDENKRATFYHVPEITAWSGLKKQWYPADANPKEIEIDVKRLDDVVPVDLTVDFIKIDVEGAEMGVLGGARRTLERCKPIVLFEHAEMHAKEYGTTPEMVYDFFDQCGMVIYGLDGTGPLTKEAFAGKYRYAADTQYGKKAEVNFLAKSLEGR